MVAVGRTRRTHLSVNIEEALRQMQSKAAVVRYLGSTAVLIPDAPDAMVLAGVGEVCEDIERLSRSVKKR